MQSLVFFGASVLLAEGARIKKRRHVQRSAGTDEFSSYDGKPAVGVQICDQEELEQVLKVAGESCTFLTEFFDGLPADGSCVEDSMVCDLEVVPELMAVHPTKVKLIQEDAGAYFRSTAGKAKSYVAVAGQPLSDDFFAEWRTFDAMDARVAAAVAGSGGIAKMEVAGQSLEGRDMKLVRFTGKGYVPGSGKKVVLTFNLHAREWITGMAGVYAVENLVKLVQSNPSTLDGVEVVMMPMANPDGFIYTETTKRYHRKNTNSNNSLCTGTDLNRNFPTGWDTCSSLQCGTNIPCLDTFKGREAASEPETKVIMNVLNEAKMSVMIDVHSFTQLILASWGYTDEVHPRAAEFAQLGNAMKDAVAARHETNWKYGTAPEILYKAVGTLTDYATSLGALGYCYELRPESKAWSLLGFSPPESYILPSAEECFDGIKVAIEHAKNE